MSRLKDKDEIFQKRKLLPVRREGAFCFMVGRILRREKDEGGLEVGREDFVHVGVVEAHDV